MYQITDELTGKITIANTLEDGLKITGLSKNDFITALDTGETIHGINVDLDEEACLKSSINDAINNLTGKQKHDQATAEYIAGIEKISRQHVLNIINKALDNCRKYIVINKTDFYYDYTR